MKETLQAGVGYMTSALESFQFVPSYRFSFNYNFNQGTKLGEFMVHDAALYVNHNALARLNWGIRLEAMYTLQDQTNGDSSSLSSYSFLVPIAPYLNYSMNTHWSLSFELSFTPQHYYADSDFTETLKRSGLDFSPKIFFRNNRGGRFWNPGFGLIIDDNGASGSEYSGSGPILELSDLMKLDERQELKLTADWGYTKYTKRPSGPRYDNTVSFDANFLHKFKEHYTALADLQYIDNISNVPDLYQYNRWLVSAGVGYNF